MPDIAKLRTQIQRIGIETHENSILAVGENPNLYGIEDGVFWGTLSGRKVKLHTEEELQKEGQALLKPHSLYSKCLIIALVISAVVGIASIAFSLLPLGFIALPLLTAAFFGGKKSRLTINFTKKLSEQVAIQFQKNIHDRILLIPSQVIGKNDPNPIRYQFATHMESEHTQLSLDLYFGRNTARLKKFVEDLWNAERLCSLVDSSYKLGSFRWLTPIHRPPLHK